MTVQEVNYVDIVSEHDVINELTFSPLVKSIPRKQDLKITTKKKIEVDWSISESCFVENKNDDDDVYFFMKNNCLIIVFIGFDWKVF